MTWEEISRELFEEKTEKRFIIDSIGVFHDNHNALHDLEVVDLLNALNDENEQLKKENQALKSELANCEEDYIIEEYL